MTDAQEQEKTRAEQEFRGSRAAACGKILGNLFIGLTVICFVVGQAVPAVFFGVLAGASELIRSRSEKKGEERVSSGLDSDLVYEFFRNMEYDPFGHISDIRIKEAEMVFPFGRFNTVEGSNHIQGAYHDTEVELSDIELLNVECERDRDSGTEREDRKLLFKGRWFICSLERKLPGDVRVSAKTKGLSRCSTKIEMNNEEFDRRFLVTADDPQSAFRVLTPHRMEHILLAADRSGGDLYLSFLRDGTIHVAVGIRQDFFEMENSWENSIELRQKFLKELRWFTDIIDELTAEETG